MTTNGQTAAHRFEEVRSSLFGFKDHDKSDYEFYVRNLQMVDRQSNICICTLILCEEAPTKEKPAFVLVREQWSNMFPSHHLSCAFMPPDGNWTQEIHDRNITRLLREIKASYEDDKLEMEAKASEIVAARRQLMMYAVIFKDAKVDPRPTQLEAALFVDATLAGVTGNYISALAEYVGKYQNDLNNI